MAAENNFNATQMPACVYDADGNRFETTRPNARELVATGKYYWATTDIGKSRIEDDGPADPAADMIEIYDSETGEPVSVARANAREIVSNGSHTWTPPQELSLETEAEVSSAEILDENPTEDEQPVVKLNNEPVVEDPLDPTNSPLHEISQRVNGDADVAKYLNDFSSENLREMAAKRYGERVHHRASKETIISKILELEESKNAAEDVDES